MPLLLIGSSPFSSSTQIRLGFLCEMVVVGGVLFAVPGGMLDQWIAIVAGPAVAISARGAGIQYPGVATVLSTGLWVYLLLLPFAHGGLYYNFYLRRAFPGPIQWAPRLGTNAFGIIIWRVFSVDIVNFFVRLWREPREGGVRTPMARSARGRASTMSAR